MNKRGVVKVVLAVALFNLVAASGWAGGKGGPGGQGGPGGKGGPPPEAISACKGKQAGDSVTFTGRRGETLEATCKEMDGQLAAVPKNPPKNGVRK